MQQLILNENKNITGLQCCRSGFTLIELLVTIAVMATLLAIMWSFNSKFNSSRQVRSDATMLSAMVKEAEQASKVYLTETRLVISEDRGTEHRHAAFSQRKFVDKNDKVGWIDIKYYRFSSKTQLDFATTPTLNSSSFVYRKGDFPTAGAVSSYYFTFLPGQRGRIFHDVTVSHNGGKPRFLIQENGASIVRKK